VVRASLLHHTTGWLVAFYHSFRNESMSELTSQDEKNRYQWYSSFLKKAGITPKPFSQWLVLYKKHESMDVSPQGTQRDDGPVVPMDGDVEKNAATEQSETIKQVTNPWNGFWESFFNAAQGGKPEVEQEEEKPVSKKRGVLSAIFSGLMDEYSNKNQSAESLTEDFDRAIRIQLMAQGLDAAIERQDMIEKFEDAIDHEQLKSQMNRFLEQRLMANQMDDIIDQKIMVNTFDTEINSQLSASESYSLEADIDQYTNTPEFKQWFGNSHAIHEKTGKPLVLYHGTEQPSAESIDKNGFNPSSSGLYGWFSPDPRYANHFTETLEDDGGILGPYPTPTGAMFPVHLSVQNPKSVMNEFHFPQSKKEVEDLIRQGHDGVITGEGDKMQIAVFSPHQIKSIFNKKPTSDPRLHYALSENQKIKSHPVNRIANRMYQQLMEQYGYSDQYSADGGSSIVVIGENAKPDRYPDKYAGEQKTLFEGASPPSTPKQYDWEPPSKIEPDKRVPHSDPNVDLQQKDYWNTRWSIRNAFRDHLANNDQIPSQHKANVLAHVHDVLESMPHGAIKRLNSGLGRVRIYPSVKGVHEQEDQHVISSDAATKAYLDQESEKDAAQLPPNLQEMRNKPWTLRNPDYNDASTHAFYDPKDRSIHLPHQSEGSFSVGGRSILPRGIYAHEMAHAIDHGEFEDIKKGTVFGGYYIPSREKLSDSLDWNVAYQKEIDGGRLNSYANQDPGEGFAEFARLAWDDPQIAKEVFPESFAFFLKHGLVNDYTETD